MKSEYRISERGGAGIKLLIVAVILILIAHAGYNYIPVLYQGQSFKQEMQTAVINGVAIPGQGKTPVDNIKEKLLSAARSNDLPANTVIEVKQTNNVIQARVAYSKQVPILPFGLYTRTYEFDHIATPNGFLTQ